jgi:hypothetical protein
MKLLPHLSSSILLTFSTLANKKELFIPCFLTVYLCDKAECVGMPKDDQLHRHGECYSCFIVFCFEHIAKSKKNMLALACMVKYCDNILCGKCTVSEEERSGCVGLGRV